jgi:hypothetical protein
MSEITIATPELLLENSPNLKIVEYDSTIDTEELNRHFCVCANCIDISFCSFDAFTESYVFTIMNLFCNVGTVMKNPDGSAYTAEYIGDDKYRLTARVVK